MSYKPVKMHGNEFSDAMTRNPGNYRLYKIHSQNPDYVGRSDINVWQRLRQHHESEKYDRFDWSEIETPGEAYAVECREWHHFKPEESLIHPRKPDGKILDGKVLVCPISGRESCRLYRIPAGVYEPIKMELREFTRKNLILPGNYRLYRKDSQDPAYVGWSGDDYFAAIRKDFEDDPDYLWFEWRWFKSPKKAYRTYCQEYHHFDPPENEDHPKKPNGIDVACPVCEE